MNNYQTKRFAVWHKSNNQGQDWIEFQSDIEQDCIDWIDTKTDQIANEAMNIAIAAEYELEDFDTYKQSAADEFEIITNKEEL